VELNFSLLCPAGLKSLNDQLASFSAVCFSLIATVFLHDIDQCRMFSNVTGDTLYLNTRKPKKSFVYIKALKL